MGKIYTENYLFNLAILTPACKPKFLKLQPWSLAWVYGPGTPSAMPNLVNSAQKIAHGACRCCTAMRRWCILISIVISYFGFRITNVIFGVTLRLSAINKIHWCVALRCPSNAWQTTMPLLSSITLLHRGNVDNTRRSNMQSSMPKPDIGRKAQLLYFTCIRRPR